MFRWFMGKGASQREVRRVQVAIGASRWRSLARRLPFLGHLGREELETLKERTAWFLASKRFTPVQGFELTDDMMLLIATQASLPVLHLPTKFYEGWTQVIVYPGAFLVPHREVDEAGVVHEFLAPTSGEAWDGGPVVLSWHDVHQADGPASNVVIHEFAHKIDLYTGQADGIPFLDGHPDLSYSVWRTQLTQTFEAFVRQTYDGTKEHTWALDSYGASDPAEFFAVSSEAFFLAPVRLAQAWPQWYDLLRRFYRQDPAKHQM